MILRVWLFDLRLSLCPLHPRVSSAVVILLSAHPMRRRGNPEPPTLRKDLAAREQADLHVRKTLTVPEFRRRSAQLLISYGRPAREGAKSYLQKLIRGMPERLRMCRERRYGR